MIPILEEAGVAVAPLDALPTIKDYLKLVWGHFTGEENFKVDFSKGSVCCQPTGWRSGEATEGNPGKRCSHSSRSWSPSWPRPS